MMSCPSASILARLGIDFYQDETLSTLEGHIQGCPDCQAELNRLVRNDAAGAASASLPARDDPLKLPGFVIERELGRGSMSVVYLARQPSLGRLVALKVVRSGPSAGSREYARWLREGRSFSALRHENVVRLYDVGEADGWLYLVLEYVPGGTLHDRLDVPYAARDAARLLAAIADAVEAIHRAGLLHLDLKPSNILMDAAPGVPRERANPRVGDFGLASLRDDPDATANTINPTGPIGTPRYMAPEQVGAGRERLGPAADVYGLGALLYHVITGRPPFAAPSVAETLDQVRDQDPVPPRRLNPAIPRDLETICLKCLRKEPGQRYASAQAVADDLRRFLDGVAISARPVSPAEKTWRWCRRRPAVAALAAALVLAIGGGFLGMFLLWRQAESQRGQAVWERSQAERERGQAVWERQQAEQQRRRARTAQDRAEAEAGRAAELLGQLIELNAGGAGNLPRVLSPERRIALLRLVRRNLFELADLLPDRQAMYSQLMSVDQRLGETLREESRPDEMRALYEHLRSARRRGCDPAVPPRRVSAGMALLRPPMVSPRSPRNGEEARRNSWPCTARTVSRLFGTNRTATHLAPIRSPASSRDVAGWRGPSPRKVATSRPGPCFWPIPRRWKICPRIGSTRWSWPPRRRSTRCRIFRHLGIDPPPGPSVGADGPLHAIAELGSAEADRLSAEAWATSAARALRFEDPDRPATFRETRAAQWFTYWIHTIACDQRNRGQLIQAGQNADRLVAFARLVVERNPHDPDAHLVLADAYDQVGKNAWRVLDRPTIQLTLRQAIEANRCAAYWT